MNFLKKTVEQLILSENMMITFIKKHHYKTSSILISPESKNILKHLKTVQK